jgi:hypothetical protein
LISKVQSLTFQHLLGLIPLTLLLVQTFWALPGLDARAALHILHQTVPPSNLHFYYVGMEVAKIICLTLFGITLFTKS